MDKDEKFKELLELDWQEVGSIGLRLQSISLSMIRQDESKIDCEAIQDDIMSLRDDVSILEDMLNSIDSLGC